MLAGILGVVGGLFWLNGANQIPGHPCGDPDDCTTALTTGVCVSVRVLVRAQASASGSESLREGGQRGSEGAVRVCACAKETCTCHVKLRFDFWHARLASIACTIAPGQVVVGLACVPFLYFIYLQVQEFRYAQAIKAEMEAREQDPQV